MLRRSERQRIEAGDRARAHGEDVAQDAADAGRRALIGLDVGGVVVALDAERHRDSVAGIDHAGVLTGADQHRPALAGQAPQVQPAGLVGAVLGPHDGVHRQFQVVGGAAEDALDGGGLVVGEPEGPVDRLVGGHAAQHKGWGTYSRTRTRSALSVTVRGRMAAREWDGPEAREGSK